MILSALFVAVVVMAWLVFAILTDDYEKEQEKRWEEDETQTNNKN